jgi:hypothetical protein
MANKTKLQVTQKGFSLIKVDREREREEEQVLSQTRMAKERNGQIMG